MKPIVIVDYGMANLRSVQKALEKLGHGAVITGDPQQVSEAQQLVLPGVGAFRDAIRCLRETGLAPAIVDHIRAGRLRALGISTPARLELLPDVPPIADFVPGYETTAFAGLSAPAATPREIIGKLNKAVGVALANPALQAKIVDMGGVPMPMTPAEFGKFLAEETEKWAKVIRAANMKPG